ncbi:tRNA dimethylallyltransferase [Anaerosporomusa subterranea]|uniref:tRNA dimethylallyltransferase n=1 Tax=Anaerosporomusa subterranea TaxID=1794912 RepID=A0A154BSZ3_ANASB|nr:tRNA (adenosine(37)-N6)-dimethylallyltransferase MiaA [Anaerosporomusa subterranea]KYZ77144.1 tRNA dimethylallyltransferase [Anaerosporomusa subterranea]
MERLIAVVGPTAVGKTKVSIDLASYLYTKIISGDSMLVYRGLDIGTAKPTQEEQAGIIHELIDIRDPGEEFSVVDFKQLASECITRVNATGRIPVIAGGTGLYIKALLEDYGLTTPPGDELIRQELKRIADEQGNERLYQLLAESDPVKAALLHPNDVRRIIRALEIRMLTTKPVIEDSAAGLKYDSLVIGLSMDREKLYERINRRVDTMIAMGLADEVKRLVEQGVPLTSQAMQAIGYKQMIGYVKGEYSLADAAEAIKLATRHFAKRQMTWYRKMPYIRWVNVDEYTDHSTLMEHIYNLVAEKFGIE